MVRFSVKAEAFGEKRKRNKIMLVLIIFAVVFAYQIYAPAFAGAWPRPPLSGYVALKRGHVSGSTIIAAPRQIGEPGSGIALQSAYNTQAQEIYGEYALSPHILFVGKRQIQRARLATSTSRTDNHELGVQTPMPFLAVGLLPPATMRILRFIFPAIKFSRDSAAAAQIFHYHTRSKTFDSATTPTSRQDGAALTVATADRLSWGRYHLTQNLAVTQFDSRSSGVWKSDYEIQFGYAQQISLGWVSETYQDHAQSYAGRNSYATISFTPPEHRFNVRFLHGKSIIAGQPDTRRSYRLEVGWSFP
jgi:hypothetical protein